LVAAVHGTCYVSGAPGAAYLPLDRFAEAGIAIEVQDWSAPVTRNGLRNPSIIHLLASTSPAEASALLGTALATAQPAGP
jgi:hypothetical protein